MYPMQSQHQSSNPAGSDAGPSQRAAAVVIGGGPAGSVAATLLARGGVDVALIERERFPREHVGESLLPASMPVLEDLGVLAQMDAAGFPKKYGATMLWGRDSEPWSWHFSETNRAYPHAYQVWRAEFDKILLDNARAHGVRVREGHAVTAPIMDGERVAGVVVRAPNGLEYRIEADWTLDASGQAAILSRSLGLRQWDDYFQNMAVYSYFDAGERLSAPNSNDIFIESYHDGWAWNIPLSGGASSVGVVVDSEAGRAGIAERGVAGYFARQLRLTTRTSAMLAKARMTTQPRALKDWSYTSSSMAGAGWILVGDAACFVDPLFSSGVHLAMMSGTMAAAYVRAAIEDPSIAKPAAEVYRQLYAKEYSHFRELARLFYASNRTAESYFWEARRILDTPEDEAARQSFIRAVAGQSPRGYERAVLDRGDIPASFSNAMREIEQGRQMRSAGFDTARALDSAPSLDAGVRIERKPIFAEGKFSWGIVMHSQQRPEGLPISNLVAALTTGMDGRRTTRQIVEHLTANLQSEADKVQVAEALIGALKILVTDGAVNI